MVDLSIVFWDCLEGHPEACVAMEDEEPQILTRWAVP